LRPERPPASARQARRIRAGLAPGQVRRFRVALAAGLAGAVTAGIVAVAVGREQGQPAPPVAHPMPAQVVLVLERAADNTGDAPELHPKPGQFLVFKSVEMNTSEGDDGRYLYREKRTIWRPVKGDDTHSVLETQALAPRQWPGWPIPAWARHQTGRRSGPMQTVQFDGTVPWLRNDYYHLSRLPTDPAKMYEHLYAHLGNGPQADATAWQNVGILLDEAYMPAAQRSALFRAAAAIRGVTTVGKAVDAVGRVGIAVALVEPGTGLRDEYIFDPNTYQYLGERSVVTNAALAGAPVGTVLTATAQLRVWIADHAPHVKRH
jgi:hypothetical protein